MSHLRTFLSALLGPTSTPFVRKTSKALPKDRKPIGKYVVKVSVHDGLAMRSVTICSLDTLHELLEKICAAMKRPNHKVEMGFDAPWSSKIGSKKCVAYISNAEELADFWNAYARCLEQQKKKQKGNAEVVVSGIVFHNLMDSAQVSSSASERVRSHTDSLQPSTKRSGATQGSKASVENGGELDARDSAVVKKTESAQKIQVGMFCKAHNRLCYQKFDGTCGAYTPDNVLEHATLLVSCTTF